MTTKRGRKPYRSHKSDANILYAERLLFRERLNELGGNTIFANASDLARRLIDNGTYSDSGQERSFATFLSQVFYSGKGQRPCPENLESAILESVKRRLETLPETDREIWLGRIERAMKLDRRLLKQRKRKQRRPNNEVEFLDHNMLYFEMLEDAVRCRECFFATGRIDEWHIPPAAALYEIILWRLGMLTSILEGSIREPTTSFVFNFPEEDLARRWWWHFTAGTAALLKEKGRGEVSRDVVQKELAQLSEAGWLRAQVLPMLVWCYPMVFFDYTYSRPAGYATNGYVINYHGYKPSVALVNTSGLLNWLEYIYWPIRDGFVEVVPVPFSIPGE